MPEAIFDKVLVTVVTGFLGAGKTTVVNRWLARQQRGEIAVVVNEYGVVGIDGSLIDDRVKEIVEIAGGCVCCSTQTELASALDQLASSSKVKRILVETSGAASPAGVIRVIGGRAACVLDGVITVVDGSRLDVLDDHELAIEQIGYADVIVVSRADLLDEKTTEASISRITQHNGAALVRRSKRGQIEGLDHHQDSDSLDALLEERRADFHSFDHAHAHHHHTSHAYESISLVHDGELDGDRFADFMETELARFAGRLLRTKGILAIAGIEERMIVQGVADLAEITFGAPWKDDDAEQRTSRLVVVGFGLDRSALTDAFLACVCR